MVLRYGMSRWLINCEEPSLFEPEVEGGNACWFLTKWKSLQVMRVESGLVKAFQALSLKRWLGEWQWLKVVQAQYASHYLVHHRAVAHDGGIFYRESLRFPIKCWILIRYFSNSAVLAVSCRFREQ